MYYTAIQEKKKKSSCIRIKEKNQSWDVRETDIGELLDVTAKNLASIQGKWKPGSQL